MRFIETLTSFVKSRPLLHRSEFELSEQKSLHLIIVIEGLGSSLPMSD